MNEFLLSLIATVKGRIGFCSGVLKILQSLFRNYDFFLALYPARETFNLCHHNDSNVSPCRRPIILCVGQQLSFLGNGPAPAPVLAIRCFIPVKYVASVLSAPKALYLEEHGDMILNHLLPSRLYPAGFYDVCITRDAMTICYYTCI